MSSTKQSETSNSATKSAAVRARDPRWMRFPELARAVAEMNEAIEPLGELPKADLQRMTRLRLREKIEYIDNEHFSDTTAGVEIFSEPLELADSNKELGFAAVKKAGGDLPIHLGRLCEAPLLKPHQEKMLFQRMNFLRQQAAQHLQWLNPQRPSKARLELVQKLMFLADWHRDRIVEANLRLVFSIVKKFVNATNDFDELLSDGIMAIIRAVEKFDFDRGFRFSTYATQVIRRNSYRTVMVVHEDRQKTVSGLQDMDIDIADEGRGSAISEKRWHALRKRLGVMLDDLDRREKFIIRARFSLGSHRKVHTLQALANRLGVSKERVRQLERRAMDKLRVMAGDPELVDVE